LGNSAQALKKVVFSLGKYGASTEKSGVFPWKTVLR
jgi:hypothetical protein